MFMVGEGEVERERARLGGGGAMNSKRKFFLEFDMCMVQGERDRLSERGRERGGMGVDEQNLYEKKV